MILAEVRGTHQANNFDYIVSMLMGRQQAYRIIKNWRMMA